MSIKKKALSIGMSAGLIASLFATAVAPTALAAITVGNAGNVPLGGTSAANVSFTFTEQTIASLSNNPGSFTVTILPALPGVSGLSFVGTPSTVGSTGSLGASASIAGNVLTVSIAGSDINNIETIVVSGLKISAASGTTLGAIRATLGITAPNAQWATAGAVATTFSGGGTATGTIVGGIGIGATSVVVNVTSAGCNFSSAGTLNFATSPESVALTTASALGVPAPGQQTLNPIGATANVHNAGEVVSETNGCAATTSLASPGTVVAAVSYGSAGNATVYPGESNQFASNLTVTEPSAGFLAAGSTFTFTIQTPGVVFSTAPTIAGTAPFVFVYTGGAVLSAPVISASRTSATVTVNTASTTASTFTLSNILYDVASSVAPGTFISVGLTTSGALAVLPPTNTNAVVFRGIAASAPSPTVYIGENNQTAGLITFKEAAAGFFTDGIGTSNNIFEICPVGVTYAFTLAPVAMVVGGTAGGNLILRDGAAASTTNIVVGTNVGGGCYQWTVWTASTTASTIVIGAAPSAATGALINVTSDQAPGGVSAALWIGSSSFVTPLTLAATVQFATAMYRNQVAVTALSQPAIAPGSTSAAAGSISIAETGIGQLKATEVICVEILPRSAAQTIQDTFLAASDIASVPVVTATGSGLVISPVDVFTPCAPTGEVATSYSTSFSFTVLQQATAGDGKLVISNIHYTTTADAHLGTVLVRVFGQDVHFGGTTQDFLSTVSNATIGSAAPISALSAVGIPPNQGPWSTATKLPARGQYVTWQFNGGSSRAGHLYQIWFAKKNSAGGWGPFTLLTSRLANASGVANFWWKTSTAAWVSVRAYDASTGTWSWSPQARWR